MKKTGLNLLNYGEYIAITFGIFLIGCLITGLIETSIIPIVLCFILGCLTSNLLFIRDQKKLKEYRQSHPDFVTTPRERLISFILYYWILTYGTIATLVYLATKYIHE